MHMVEEKDELTPNHTEIHPKSLSLPKKSQKNGQADTKGDKNSGYLPFPHLQEKQHVSSQCQNCLEQSKSRHILDDKRWYELEEGRGGVGY